MSMFISIILGYIMKRIIILICQQQRKNTMRWYFYGNSWVSTIVHIFTNTDLVVIYLQIYRARNMFLRWCNIFLRGYDKILDRTKKEANGVSILPNFKVHELKMNTYVLQNLVITIYSQISLVIHTNKSSKLHNRTGTT